MSYRKYLMTDDVPPSELYKTVKIDTDSDTISRQAAIDALNHELRCGAVIDQCGLEVAYEVIEDLPPAEPQIIRCKDCKHYKYGMCMKICASKSTNGFCDWGERKEVTT